MEKGIIFDTLDDSPFTKKKKANYKIRLEEVKKYKETDMVVSRKIQYIPQHFVKFVLETTLDFSDYFTLSGYALKLLHYIVMFKLEYNSTVFILDAKEAAIMLNIKDFRKIYKLTKELQEKNFIAKTPKRQIYWINHNRFFKGTFITSKTIKVK